VYLQSIELIGFKSFANKTRLVFEPGITAIVGPNGCGKSNISDAIRWVLGEQRPTALRSSTMTDVIFNGTDLHKPHGMTEVSISFAECEKELGTDYHEVTVTRRVFRTGEGHYYLNKTPCRLRDIQRLFMNTGIGTASYSVMAQGQIDAILSSKPEDRRAIFEEASGITRFRADRKEAMRKLSQTDANLLRLNDVIRELHRQIGSLQRQAGKARRYKELQAELRQYDLYLTRHRISGLRKNSDRLAGDIARINKTLEGLRANVQAGETRNAEAREKLMDAERQIGSAMELAMEAQGRSNQAGDAIRINEQRIAEYAAWIERDNREISERKTVCEKQKQELDAGRKQLTELENERAFAEEALAETRQHFDTAREANTAARNSLQQLRTESVEAERQHVSLQNALTAAENAARESMLRKERLLSEKSNLETTVTDLGTRLQELESETKALTLAVQTKAQTVANTEHTLDALRATLRNADRDVADTQSRIAVQRARIQLLSDPAKHSGQAPAGNTQLLKAGNPLGLPDGAVLGPLAEQFSTPKAYRAALEAVLRAWADAVAVKSPSDAAAAVRKLKKTDNQAGTRMIVAETGNMPEPIDLKLPTLLQSISCKPPFQNAATRLLGNVFIVDTLEAIPDSAPAGCTFVTLDGAVVFPEGLVERYVSGGNTSDPLARHMLAEDARAEMKHLEASQETAETQSEALRDNLETTTHTLKEARDQLETSRRTAAQKEGEENTLRRDLSQTETRLLSTEKELTALAGSADSATVRASDITERIREMAEVRQRLASAVEAQVEIVQTSEGDFLHAQTQLTETRLAHASLNHRTENMRMQHKAGSARIEELDRMIQSRLNGIQSYEEGVARLTSENAKLQKQLVEYSSDVETRKIEVARLRETRAINRSELNQAEQAILEVRRSLDSANEAHGKAEIEQAEARLRLQTIQDRLMIDWHLSIDQLATSAVPDWGSDGEPSEADAEAQTAAIRTKMESMGPVNLVAIEEHKQIEDRHAFLTAQEADLVNAKTKLLELIKEIDKESTERFLETFEKAKVNFQNMFNRLFDGGTAELALMDETDILECGIDIIARPPGKKPQSISLLSGGERTLTAVALLFAIYSIRPSPFAMLDELDAALDDANIGRFVGVLNDFRELSQFLIITHNQHTIAGADIVYGVTQQHQGISKIISMRLKGVGIEEPQGEKLPEMVTPPPIKRRKKKQNESI